MQNNAFSFKHLALLACVLSSPLVSACILPSVVSGGPGESGSGGAGTSGGVNTSGGVDAGGGVNTSGGVDTGGGPAVPTTNNLALRGDELPANPNGLSSSVGSGAGPAPDPDTLQIELSSLPITCGDPYSIGGPGCDNGWHIYIPLPVAYQKPGVYSLSSDPDLVATFVQELSDGTPGGCSGGGGSFNQGTVEVVSIDGHGLVVRLKGTGWLNADGDYQVPRCTPVATPVAQAIALRADQLPGSNASSGSSAASGGGNVDPATLYVITGNHALACSDPYADQGCATEEWEVTVGLPVAYQKPGMYALSDPAIISTFGMSQPASTPNTCEGGGGSFIDGKIEVVSVDASSIVVRFSGVSSYQAELAQDIHASRCP